MGDGGIMAERMTFKQHLGMWAGIIGMLASLGGIIAGVNAMAEQRVTIRMEVKANDEKHVREEEAIKREQSIQYENIIKMLNTHINDQKEDQKEIRGEIKELYNVINKYFRSQE